VEIDFLDVILILLAYSRQMNSSTPIEDAVSRARQQPLASVVVSSSRLPQLAQTLVPFAPLPSATIPSLNSEKSVIPHIHSSSAPS